MASKEVLKLPETGEAPLTGEDIISMARWVRERATQGNRLRAAADASRKAAYKLAAEDPKSLISSLENPALTRFKSAEVYEIGNNFGLSEMYSAAYDKLYKLEVGEFDTALSKYFQDQDATIEATFSTEAYQVTDWTGVGIYHTSHGPVDYMWDSRNQINWASGQVVGINLDEAKVRLRTDHGREYGLRLLAPFVVKPEVDLHLDLQLHYPPALSASA